MKKLLWLLVILPLLFSCEVPETADPGIGPDSFLPMHIGNYWRNGEHTYTEIQDTVRMNNKLYYKFFSLTGGDAISTKYLRIDDNNQLWEGYPTSTAEYLHAKFDASINDTFQTLNDQTWNDYKVRLVEKTDNKRTFEFDMIYHPNLKGHPHTVTYIKGKGWSGPWQSLRINGKIYNQ